MFKKAFISSLILGCVCATQAQNLTSEYSVNPIQKENKGIFKKSYIPNSVTLQITPKGMKYFENNIYQLIQQQGAIQIEENKFAPIATKLDPISTSDLIKDPEQLKLVENLQKFISQWLHGLTITQTHQFVVNLGESQYQIRFKKVVLYTDAELLSQIGKKEGAVFVLEIEADRLEVKASQIRVFDYLNQSILPTIGADDMTFSLKQKNTQERIKIKIPIYVSMNSETSQLVMKVLTIDQNLENFDLDLKYKKIITSEYKIIIEKNDEGEPVKRSVVDVNMKNFSDLLNENRDRLLLQTKKALLEFVNYKLPEFINKKSQEYFKQELSFTHEVPLKRPYRFSELSLSNKPSNDVASFLMGHNLVLLNQNKGLTLQLKSFIEDPLNPKSVPQVSPLKKYPSLEFVEGSDAVMILNHALIERMSQLYAERGYLSDIGIESCDGTKTQIKVVKTPQLLVSKRALHSIPEETYSRIRSMIEVKAPEDVAYVTKNGFLRLSAEVDLKIKKAYLKRSILVKVNGQLVQKEIEDLSESRLDIYIDRVDPESLSVEASSLGFIGKLGLWFGVVDKKIKQVIAGINQPDPQCGPTKPLLENLPVPPAIYGIKFDILKLKMTPEGPLVMYLKYL